MSIKGLDRYLTSGPPDDGFDEFCESVLDLIPEDIWNANEDWFIGDECNKLLAGYFDSGKSKFEISILLESYLNDKQSH